MPNHKKHFLDEPLIVKKYENGESTVSISKEFGCNSNTIRRILIKNGVDIRTKSEAQSAYLENNPHPMKGVKMTKKQKHAKSLAIENYYANLSDAEKEALNKRRVKRNKQQWKKKSRGAQKTKMRNMQVANRVTTVGGSKFENLFAKFLLDKGHKIEQRTKEYSSDGKTEIDILMVQEKIAVEIDGPSHYKPIYGEENLAKVMAKDANKDALLLSGGLKVVRIRNLKGKLSQLALRQTYQKLLEIIDLKPIMLYIIEVD